jgi:hypothetical protein
VIDDARAVEDDRDYFDAFDARARGGGWCRARAREDAEDEDDDDDDDAGERAAGMSESESRREGESAEPEGWGEGAERAVWCAGVGGGCERGARTGGDDDVFVADDDVFDDARERVATDADDVWARAKTN